MLALALVQIGFPSAGAQDQFQTRAGVPIFEVDPRWPSLPEKWALGQVGGMAVDAQDHVWVSQRPTSLDAQDLLAAQDPPLADCCTKAPPILEFDEAGKFIRGWGGAGTGYEWTVPTGPETRAPGDGRAENAEHGIHVDYRGNVWVGGNSTGDHQILKFTRDGTFRLQIGRRGQSKGSNDTANVNRSTGYSVDPKTNELFVADGYGNRRVIVFDADTGAYKRHWGAYGNRPDDSTKPARRDEKAPPPQQFNTVHGLTLSKDGYVYVADRGNNRVQVFRMDGMFVKEAFIKRGTGGPGTAFGMALSADPPQRFLYVADGSNGQIVIMDRSTLEIVGQVGRIGRASGQFYHLHGIATDSKGNIYTGESLGYRVQKFVYKGLSTAATAQRASR
jgi:DNA-binding beta-propeller fold protein YncE